MINGALLHLRRKGMTDLRRSLMEAAIVVSKFLIFLLE